MCAAVVYLPKPGDVLLAFLYSVILSAVDTIHWGQLCVPFAEADTLEHAQFVTRRR